MGDPPSSLADSHPIELPTPNQWHTEVIVEHQSQATPYTLHQVLAHAKTNHPSIHAASREIDIARAGITTANTKPNPNLVLDLDTPLHDRDDATELTTRVTFPFGGSKERQWRRRVAMAQVIKAEANFQATVRQVSDAATAAAIRSIYLQQRLALDTRVEQLAIERRQALTEGLPSDNPAKNLLDQMEARIDVDQATQIRFATERELATTSSILANRMGMNRYRVMKVVGTLEEVPLELPSLDEVITNSEQESEQIIVALANLNESRAFHCLQHNIGTDKQFGPRYQDRLGRDDDTLGVRLDLDLDVHRVQQGPIAQSVQAMHQQQDRVALARHQWLGEVTRIHRELESLTAELAHYRNDQFLAEQRELLSDETAARFLTAAQRIEIERSVVRRELDQLERQYAIAVLRSQIRLETGIE